MINKNLICFFLLVMSIFSYAQEIETETKKPKKFAIALNGSTLGVGGEVAMSLSEKFAVRLRGQYLNIDAALGGQEEEIGGETFIIDGGPGSTAVDLSIEYLPFKRSSFKLVGGVGYFFDGQLSFMGVNETGFTYGELKIEAEDVGTVDFQMDYSGVAPYFGLGFGRAIPKKRVGFGFELGSFYTGEPQATIVTTEMMSENVTLREDRFQQDISDYRWYPFINLRIAVKLLK
ncbi:hypothetical protein SAMN05216480_10891 [Pustulibacterium marinum]|uniref:Outer membrane protein beta-barrel domain-containing protein n=1 Tax=Pustulibacterium marinum TaxID=1224947 RepID=A0A1I7HBN5_9FLAO|nr:hypothetical protein [Pustulibacterium marinum]SFU58128.1 hypothetical protein SAMN05216480_10891 [Pustulibacterium marinum]